jgi:hypothetical protein
LLFCEPSRPDCNDAYVRFCPCTEVEYDAKLGDEQEGVQNGTDAEVDLEATAAMAALRPDFAAASDGKERAIRSERVMVDGTPLMVMATTIERKKVLSAIYLHRHSPDRTLAPNFQIT